MVQNARVKGINRGGGRERYKEARDEARAGAAWGGGVWNMPVGILDRKVREGTSVRGYD